MGLGNSAALEGVMKWRKAGVDCRLSPHNLEAPLKLNATGFADRSPNCW